MTRARFTLRRATVADAPAMWDIRAEAIRVTCRSRYPEAMLARWAATPMPGTIVANIERGYFTAGILESSIAGFAAINVAAAEIEALFVAPAYPVSDSASSCWPISNARRSGNACHGWNSIHR
jgi:hypothetical protein